MHMMLVMISAPFEISSLTKLARKAVLLKVYYFGFVWETLATLDVLNNTLLNIRLKYLDQLHS